MLDLIWSFVTNLFGLRWLLINSLIAIVIYRLIFKNWQFFSKNNVNFIRGLPILGAQWRFLIGQESLPKFIIRIHNLFSSEKVFGIFDIGGRPIYFIRDPELIKQIAIKDFDHFMNHDLTIDAETDPLFARSLIIMRDQRWKSMRSILSPAFTGSKMRLMFSLIGDVSNTFCDHLKTEIKHNGPIECDIRDKFSRFSNDSIASCAFGMTVDSMANKENDFYKTNLSLNNFSGLKNLLKFICMQAAPKIARYFEFSFFSKKDCSYLRDIVKSNMDYREKNGIIRNDMINLLMQLKNDGKLTQSAVDNEIDSNIGFATVEESSYNKDATEKIQDWDDDDLVGQCLIFILGGFNTVSFQLSFLAHDLAVHSSIQTKLYEEIVDTKKSLNGKPLTYEALQKMKYLDMVVSESMRMWPQLPANDRVVTKQYELEINDGQKITLNPGQVIMFTTQGLHRDAKYFPNPENFDPERFSDENKDNIVPGTYLPFGIGPRSCIASRFALMEVKACIFHLLSNCKLEMSSKTQHPLQWRPASGTIEAEKGFWIKLKLRE